MVYAPAQAFTRDPECIHTNSLNALMFPGELHNVNFGSAVAWPSSNLAIYTPFEIWEPTTIVKLSTWVGTASGNLDLGVIDADSGAKLVSSGSTAASSGHQIIDVTDTALARGRYYFAIACDNTTITLRRSVLNTTQELQGEGLGQEVSAFALPSTITPVKVTNNYVPYWVAFRRTQA